MYVDIITFTCTQPRKTIPSTIKIKRDGQQQVSTSRQQRPRQQLVLYMVCRQKALYTIICSSCSWTATITSSCYRVRISYCCRNKDGPTIKIRRITLQLHAPLIHVFDHPRRVHVFRQKTLNEGGYRRHRLYRLLWFVVFQNDTQQLLQVLLLAATQQ